MLAHQSVRAGKRWKLLPVTLKRVNVLLGPCFVSDLPVFHVVSSREEDDEIYRVHSLPAHDQWEHVFSFQADQIQRTENDTMLFIYPPSRTGNHIISTALFLDNTERFPSDFFIARRNQATADIYEISFGSNFSNKITVSNHSTDCCSTIWTTKIPVFLLPGKSVLLFPSTTEAQPGKIISISTNHC